ncbi:hypothetical protein I7I48_09118 [Histoplasma ohiense]|nr:hypothetical protein I7I48_09118 [Histoplasma ohiense (nom. inval.)]
MEEDSLLLFFNSSSLSISELSNYFSLFNNLIQPSLPLSITKFKLKCCVLFLSILFPSSSAPFSCLINTSIGLQDGGRGDNNSLKLLD